MHTDPFAAAGLSDDGLAEQIVSWSGRLAAGEARLLDLVAEFDRREAWGGPGLLSCAHRLQWRVGLSPGAAREKVRVARRLQELPLVRAALQEGSLSYSKARAVTRVATVEDQQVWVDLAAHATAGQLERLARGVRRVHRAAEDEADPDLARYRMRASKRYDEDGTAVYTVRLPAEQAALLDAALEQTRAVLDQARQHAEGEPAQGEEHAEADPLGEYAVHTTASASGVSAETSRATLADALLALAAAVVDGSGASPARRSRAALTVQVDPLSGWGRLRDGELLPSSTLRQAALTLPGPGTPGLRPLRDDDLRRFDSGRRRRRPSAELRDLLGTLDGERAMSA